MKIILAFNKFDKEDKELPEVLDYIIKWVSDNSSGISENELNMFKSRYQVERSYYKQYVNDGDNYLLIILQQTGRHAEFFTCNGYSVDRLKMEGYIVDYYDKSKPVKRNKDLICKVL